MLWYSGIVLSIVESVACSWCGSSLEQDKQRQRPKYRVEAPRPSGCGWRWGRVHRSFVCIFYLLNCQQPSYSPLSSFARFLSSHPLLSPSLFLLTLSLSHCGKLAKQTADMLMLALQASCRQTKKRRRRWSRVRRYWRQTMPMKREKWLLEKCSRGGSSSCCICKVSLSTHGLLTNMEKELELELERWRRWGLWGSCSCNRSWRYWEIQTSLVANR